MLEKIPLLRHDSNRYSKLDHFPYNKYPLYTLEIEYACYDDEDNYEEFKQDILEKYDVKVVQATEKQAADKIV